MIPDIISLNAESEISLADSQKLSLSELSIVVASLHKVLKIEEIRLTGGEPLLYRDLAVLIAALRDLGISKIAMTTNAYLLPFQAAKLKNAGLESVNISLDAIHEDLFFAITRKNYLNRVLEGIDKAIEYGLKVKLNAVIMRGVNHEEVLPLIKYAKEKNLTIRFIELMKMGHLYHSDNLLLYTAREILTAIESNYTIHKLPREKSSTTNYWRLDNGQVVGIIANEGMPFCSDCNRLRLDEYGRIYGCISSNKGFDILSFLQNSKMLEAQLFAALKTKQKVKFKGSNRSMINVGG